MGFYVPDLQRTRASGRRDFALESGVAQFKVSRIVALMSPSPGEAIFTTTKTPTRPKVIQNRRKTLRAFASLRSRGWYKA